MASARSLLLPLIAIIIGTFMVILDTTVVNVALPTLGRVFATDLSLLQWVITGYMLAQAAVIPLSGWLSDRFGAKRVYMVSLVLFTLGSALCGLAPNAEVLVVKRALPAIAAGRAAGKLDALGIVLGPLAFASLSYGISESTSAGWTAA